MITVSTIAQILEEVAPLPLQEGYDNAGLCVGNAHMPVTGILLCLDVTEALVMEAVGRKANLIVSHHPVIFSGLKKITGASETERVVALALQHQIALYAAHTNLDSVRGAINDQLCDRLELGSRQIMLPAQGKLAKLVTYAPLQQAEQVRQALYAVGAGHLGLYRNCSFSSPGMGSYMPTEGAQPFCGTVGTTHHEPEERIEVLVPQWACSNIVAALKAAHPYEVPAYDLIALQNPMPQAGLGLVGQLPSPMPAQAFLHWVKQTLEASSIRYNSNHNNQTIHTVAVLSGSGSGFVRQAAQQADAYISGDFKYHDWQHVPPKLLCIDIGHYESEVVAIEVFYEILTKKIPNFAVLMPESIKNPVNYL